MSTLVTPIGRAAFPHLAEPQEYNGKTNYSLIVIFEDGTNLSALEEATEAILKEKFPKGVPATVKRPFRSGSEKSENTEGFEESDTFVTCKRDASFGPPSLIDQKKNEILGRDIYGGCKVRVCLRPYYYDKAGNKGVAFGLEAVQFAGEGERIGMAPVDASTVFDEISEDLASALE